MKENDSISSKKNEQYFTVKDTYNGQCVNAGFNVAIHSNAGNTLTQLHVPIHFLLDKNGHAALGDWDGNSIQINQEEGGSILTPQTGAGHVDQESGSFTGVFMGSASDKDNNIQTGLLGYSKGQQSIFLDSETGRAEFGTTSKIIIDPENNEAKIYSGDYTEKGTLLADGTTSEGAGMIINLTTPEIKFGTEKFKVDKEGKVIASDGKIAGWSIDEYGFTFEDENKVTRDGEGPAIFKISTKDYSAKIAGQNRNNWRFNIGPNFGITSEGYMYSNNQIFNPDTGLLEPVISTNGNFGGSFTGVIVDTSTLGKFTVQNGALVATNNTNSHAVTTLNGNGEVAFAAYSFKDPSTDAPAEKGLNPNTPLRLFHNGLAEFKNIDIQGGVINLYQAEQDNRNNVTGSKQSIKVKVNANTEYTFEEYIDSRVQNHNNNGNNNQSEILGKLSLYSQYGNNQPTHLYSSLPLYADGLFIKERQIIAEEWVDVPVSIMDKIQTLEDRIIALEQANSNQE